MIHGWTLAKTVLDINLKSPLDGFMLHNNIERALTGSSSISPSQETATFRDGKNKVAVLIRPTKLVIICEAPNSNNHARLILALLDRLNAVLRITETRMVRYKQVYLAEIETNTYEELVQKFKTTYFNAGSKLLAESIDVALPLTIDKYKYPVDLTVGPMRGNELNDRTLEFENKNLPEYYVITDITTTATDRHLTNKFLKEYFIDAKSIFGIIRNTVGKEWNK